MALRLAADRPVLDPNASSTDSTTRSTAASLPPSTYECNTASYDCILVSSSDLFRRLAFGARRSPSSQTFLE